MMEYFGRITTTASYVPQKIITNQQLSEIIDTSSEWIYSRTGIMERHVVTTENTSDLCTEVARQLLQKRSLQPEELDFILVATMSPDYVTPSVACQVQGNIQANNAFAFDLSAACSGFVYALSMAEKLIRTGSKKGLVIGGEVLSKVLDWQDRSTAVLFGDGAAGVLIEADDEPMIIRELLQADGKKAQSLTSGFVTNESPYAQGTKQSPYLAMLGRDIFDFATRTVVSQISEVIADDQVDYFILHQANARILDKVAKKLKQPREKFLQNMAKYGNTSAASIPILLDEAVTDGRIVLGSKQKLVFSGFGGGLTYGSILLNI